MKINIFTDHPYLKIFLENNPNVTIVDNSIDSDLNLIQGNWMENELWEKSAKTIYLMPRIHKKHFPHSQPPPYKLRLNSYYVDDLRNLKFSENFIFCRNDFGQDPKIINMPNGFLPGSCISKSKMDCYWNENINTNLLYHNKVFWRGTPNHKIRKNLIKFYSDNSFQNFFCEPFNQKVYGENSVEFRTYQNYIYTLSQSDMSYCIRGSYPGVFSFMDVLSSGCIPILINCMNYYGWENIFKNTENFMLMFDAEKQPLDDIHNEVSKVLSNKDKVLFMKSNIRNFYNKFITKDSHHTMAWAYFILAKSIEIWKGGFSSKNVSNQFISSEVLKLLGFNEKI